jgi:hypothetical protein
LQRKNIGLALPVSFQKKMKKLGKHVLLVFTFLVLTTSLFSGVVWAGPTPKVKLNGDIEKIKSEKIKESVRKIQRRIENRGNRRTTHWSEVVTRLEVIHDKLDRQRDRFERRKKDVTELNRLIKDARQKRNRTKLAISQQDAKQYMLNIRNETLIGTRISALQDTEKADLLDVQNKVTETIVAYKLALEEVKKVKVAKAIQ